MANLKLRKTRHSDARVKTVNGFYINKNGKPITDTNFRYWCKPKLKSN